MTPPAGQGWTARWTNLASAHWSVGTAQIDGVGVRLLACHTWALMPELGELLDAPPVNRICADCRRYAYALGATTRRPDSRP